MGNVTESLLNQISSHAEKVSTDSYTATWREIISLFKEGEIIISPEYQRLFRWDNAMQSEFIESLILNIPTPSIFLAENDNSKMEVIDGLQRISTLIRFFSDEIFDGKDLLTPDDEDVNNLKRPAVLWSTPMLEALEGFTNKTLPDTITRSIKTRRINIILLEKNSSKQTRHIVFKRLNRSGARLTDQEIRNCTARLFGSNFPDQLRELASEDAVINSFGISKSKQSEQFLEENILKLLAMNFYIDRFKHSVTEFLDEAMDYASNGNFEITHNIYRNVLSTFELLNNTCPNGSAFKYRKDGDRPWGAFSPVLFEIVAYGVYSNIEELTPDIVSKSITKLHSDPRLEQLKGAGSNTKAKFFSRIQLGNELFKKAK